MYHEPMAVFKTLPSRLEYRDVSIGWRMRPLDTLAAKDIAVRHWNVVVPQMRSWMVFITEFIMFCWADEDWIPTFSMALSPDGFPDRSLFGEISTNPLSFVDSAL